LRSIDLLTIRYIDEAGKVFSVKSYPCDSNERYSFTSPEKYGASPDKAVVSGSFYGRKVIEVHYNHQHVPGAAATCTVPQTCTLCGAVIAEKIPHDYSVSKVTAPTCDKNGYSTYTCSVCGDERDDAYTAPAGHKLDESFRCTVCGEQFKDALIKKALGYDATEVVEEYSTDEQGEVKLVKKKVTTKNVPPDISAIKILLDDGKDLPLTELTDAELEQEKQRLLNLLKQVSG
jgi:hypothetical protein